MCEKFKGCALPRQILFISACLLVMISVLIPGACVFFRAICFVAGATVLLLPVWILLGDEEDRCIRWLFPARTGGESSLALRGQFLVRIAIFLLWLIVGFGLVEQSGFVENVCAPSAQHQCVDVAKTK